MPYDLQGNFSRVHNWEQDRLNDIEIVSDRHDEEDDNFAEGLNECLLRDGRAALIGNLNAGGLQIKNLGNASEDGDAVNKGQFDTLSTNLQQQVDNAIEAIQVNLNNLLSIGDIKASVLGINHNDWLLCNGQAVSRSEYSELFNIIGTSFGSGDNETTFNVPDYRGKFLRGLGGNSAADIYTTQAEGLPNITGTFDSDDEAIHFSGAFYNTGNQSTNYTDGGTGDALAGFDASRSNPIYGASSHVTPINQAVNYFIKAK